MTNIYILTIEVLVTDEDALFKAALVKAITEDRLPYDGAMAILCPDGEVDSAACIQTLGDPGTGWPGTNILESMCE